MQVVPRVDDEVATTLPLVALGNQERYPACESRLLLISALAWKLESVDICSSCF